MHGARTLTCFLCSVVAAAAAAALSASCRGGGGRGAHAPPVPAAPTTSSAAQSNDEPIGVQMMRTEPQLRTQRFSTLVGFEAPSDTVFVTSTGGAARRDPQHVHTGRWALRADATSIRIKLGSLVARNAFPGDWTLLGGYVYAPEGAQLVITCQVGQANVVQRKLAVPPRRWTPALLDITSLSENPALVPRGAATALVVQIESKAAVWFDDFTLIDNDEDLFAPPDAGNSLDAPWTIRRRGLFYVVNATGRFATKLLAAESGGSAGWVVEEVGPHRARFSSTGKPAAATIYPDGRAYWDGSYRPLSAAAAEPAYVQQHLTSARVEVAEEFGRVDRDTPGDADNDGYNESRGAYQVRAAGPRLEIGFAPRTSTVIRPVFEIAGLPPGKAVVAIEGRLVEDHERLPDGTLLIDIPARVNRATTVSVKVQ
jgi:hypothetical protein